MVFCNVSCFAFSASAGLGGAGTAVLLVVGASACGAGAGLDAGAAPDGGGLLAGGTTRRVSCRADCDSPVGAVRITASVATLRMAGAFIIAENVPQPAGVGKAKESHPRKSCTCPWFL